MIAAHLFVTRVRAFSTGAADSIIVILCTLDFVWRANDDFERKVWRDQFGNEFAAFRIIWVVDTDYNFWNGGFN